MLLVPVNDYTLHQTECQTSNTDRPDLLSTTLLASPGNALVNPFLVAPCQCIAIPAPSYLFKDAMRHPYQDITRNSIQMFDNRSTSCSSSPKSISPPILQAQESRRVRMEQKEESSSILLDLLNTPSQKRKYNGSPHCGTEHFTTNSITPAQTEKSNWRVRLRGAFEITKASSKVMEKVTFFVQNLDSFRNLPPIDQDLLFNSSWAKLFVLGLAQERILFDIVLYHGNQQDREYHYDGKLPRSFLGEKEALKADEANKLKGFVQRCMDLQMTPAEHAYFMGTVLFDYDTPGLQRREVTAALQKQALHALAEYRGNSYDSPPSFEEQRGQHMRLAQILLGLPALKCIKSDVIEELFFKDNLVSRP